ncbi:hypothetical protein D9M68_602840 [compost metagenome]
MLLMLKAGRVDGIIVLGSVLRVDNHGIELDRELAAVGIENLDWTAGGLYLSKDLLPEDKQLLTRTFTELNEEGLYLRLAQGYLAAQPAWVQSSIRVESPLSL